MVNRVKSDLSGQIGRHVNRRRRSDKSDQSSFTEALSNKSAEGSRKAVPNELPTKTVRRSSGGTGRTVARSDRPSGYTRKHITRVQAQRLAGYANVIQSASRKFGVPVELICAVMLQESGGNYKAVSHCGARGLMQLMPATAKRLGVSNSFDPVQNIMGGTKYLRMLMERFDGNVALALAGYNSGEGNVEKYGRRIPPFKETQAYVPSVLKYADTLWQIMRSAPIRRADVQPTTIHHRTIFGSGRA